MSFQPVPYHKFFRGGILPIEFFNATTEEIQAIMAADAEAVAENNQLRKQAFEARTEAIKKTKELFESFGIKTTEYKKASSARKAGTYPTKEMEKVYEIATEPFMFRDSYRGATIECKLPDGSIFRNNCSPCTLIELHVNAHRYWNNRETAKKREAEAFAGYLKYAIENGIQVSVEQASDPQVFMRTVDEIASEKWFEETYPKGSEVSISCCPECSTHIVGENRCLCGNVRVSIYPNGSVLTGFYIVDERN